MKQQRMNARSMHVRNDANVNSTDLYCILRERKTIKEKDSYGGLEKLNRFSVLDPFGDVNDHSDWEFIRYSYFEGLSHLRYGISAEKRYWPMFLSFSPLLSSIAGDYPSEIHEDFTNFLDCNLDLSEALTEMSVKLEDPDCLSIIRIITLRDNSFSFEKKIKNKQLLTVCEYLNNHKGKQLAVFKFLISVGIITGQDGVFPNWLIRLGCISSTSRTRKTIFNSFLTDRGIALFTTAYTFYENIYTDLKSLNLIDA